MKKEWDVGVRETVRGSFLVLCVLLKPVKESTPISKASIRLIRTFTDHTYLGLLDILVHWVFCQRSLDFLSFTGCHASHNLFSLSPVLLGSSFYSLFPYVLV